MADRGLLSSLPAQICRHESAEMFHALRDCGVPVRTLLYDRVGHADFVTGWHVQTRVGGRPTHDTSDLAPFAADLVAVLHGDAD